MSKIMRCCRLASRPGNRLLLLAAWDRTPLWTGLTRWRGGLCRRPRHGLIRPLQHGCQVVTCALVRGVVLGYALRKDGASDCAQRALTVRKIDQDLDRIGDLLGIRQSASGG